MKAIVDATKFEHFEDCLKIIFYLRAIQCGEYKEARSLTTRQRAAEALRAKKQPSGERIDPIWWLMNKKLIKRNESGKLVGCYDKIELMLSI